MTAETHQYETFVPNRSGIAVVIVGRNHSGEIVDHVLQLNTFRPEHTDALGRQIQELIARFSGERLKF